MLLQQLQDIQRACEDIRVLLENRTGQSCGNSLTDILKMLQQVEDTRKKFHVIAGVLRNVPTYFNVAGIVRCSKGITIDNSYLTADRSGTVEVYEADRITTWSIYIYNGKPAEPGTYELPEVFCDTDEFCCWYDAEGELQATDKDSSVYIKGDALCITQEEPLNSYMLRRSGLVIYYKGNCGFSCDAGCYTINTGIHSLYIKKNNREYLYVLTSDGPKNIFDDNGK